jgi:hypothetical protein
MMSPENEKRRDVTHVLILGTAYCCSPPRSAVVHRTVILYPLAPYRVAYRACSHMRFHLYYNEIMLEKFKVAMDDDVNGYQV